MKTSSQMTLFFFLFVSIHTFAHSEKAHVHGAGELSLAFDQKLGKIEFECPADSTVGFEHVGKTNAQKKKISETLELIKTKMDQMIVFDPKLNCRILAEDVKFDIDGKTAHAETNGEFNVTCDKSPKGTLITFNFKKFFPKLKKITVQIIADDLQKSALITDMAQTLELK
jgi:hypothetical protein